MAHSRLFDVDDTRTRWTGETLPAVYQGPRHCGRCGTSNTLTLPAYVAEPLFAHGGYGEATRVTAVVCLSCGRTEVTDRQAMRPARAPRAEA